MIARPLIGAAISFLVSTVAIGKLTDFDAEYCRPVGLKLFVSIQTATLAVARFCRRFFSAARAAKTETASSSSCLVSIGRPNEREAIRLLRFGASSSRSAPQLEHHALEDDAEALTDQSRVPGGPEGVAQPTKHGGGPGPGWRSG
jgi:hypothetical protein